MERAAGHLARAVAVLAGRTYGLRVALLCGKGNNGGDGFAAGRRLLAMGAAPTVHVVPGADTLHGLPAEQLRRYRRRGGRVVDSLERALADADAAVDCLLGTGASGEPRPPYDTAVEALRSFRGHVVACDLPTGVDPDTGRVPGAAVAADVTVTLGARKRGLWLWPARGYVGREVLGDLGFDVDPAPVGRVLEPGDVAALLPAPSPQSHKRTRGVVVVLAGSPGMAGAAVMVARGAMSAGAGLVTVCTGNPDLVLGAAPEALTAQVDPAAPEATLETVLGALEGADALAVGPGLGHDDAATQVVHRLVREVEVPIVLDADGLNVFKGRSDLLADHRSPLLVCTPHAREFARLVDSGGDGVWGRRVELVPECAAAWNAVLVAKGPGSMIGAPDGRVWLNATGGAALASGGTGDVLTGLVAAGVAQQPTAERVAAMTWLHGRAGELAGSVGHVRSATALEVAAAVPAALRELDAARGA